MIACDTSTWIAYFGGDQQKDVERLDELLLGSQIVIPPVVLSELLSAPKLDFQFVKMLCDLPRLDLDGDFWIRAGKLRAKILANKYKARLADTLIAQSCIDHRVSLLTRDRDFRHFEKFGLQLVSME
jgi:predicted nucleic acid-binding protein